jgi:hypothetical protein
MAAGLLMFLAGLVLVLWTVRKGSDGRNLVDIIVGPKS